VAKTEDEGTVQVGPGQSDGALACVANFARLRCDRAAWGFVQKSFELSKPVIRLREHRPEREVACPKGQIAQAAVHPDDGVVAPLRRRIYGSDSVVEMVCNSPGRKAVAGTGQLIQVQDEFTHVV
jgi:hypothetical protein